MRLKKIPSARDESTTDAGDAEYYVLGGQAIGKAIATRLQAEGYDVCFVADGPDPPGVSTKQGDPTDVDTLKEAGLSSESTVVVTTRSDSENLLIAQLARTYFDVERIVVLANHPDQLDLLPEAGHEPVCATAAITEAVTDSI